MRIIFDPDKDAINRKKHGISLAEAVRLDWEYALVKPDSRRDYGEPRIIGYAPMADRLYCVVFVDRDETRRIISLRKANNREVQRYAKTIETYSADA